MNTFVKTAKVKLTSLERAMKKIPLFSVQKSNEISGYVPFRHTKTYIKTKSLLYSSNYDLMASIGYHILPKFKVHRKEWDELTRRVPIKYFSAIGVDLNTISFTLELDQQEYDKALELPFYPESAGIRLKRTVYRTMEFIPNTTEADAIEILKKYSSDTGRYCFITQANIKTSWVQMDGALFTTFYRPELEIGKAWVIASGTGKKFGSVSIR